MDETSLGEMAALAEGAAIASLAGLAAGGTSAAATDADEFPAALREWFERLLELLVPKVDHLDQLPAMAKPVFGVDPLEARANAENEAVLKDDSARLVLAQLANRVKMHRGPMTAGDFQGMAERDQDGDGNQGSGVVPPGTHRDHRVALGAGIRQVDPAD